MSGSLRGARFVHFLLPLESSRLALRWLFVLNDACHYHSMVFVGFATAEKFMYFYGHSQSRDWKSNENYLMTVIAADVEYTWHSWLLSDTGPL
jgi:hypothetical protein